MNFVINKVINKVKGSPFIIDTLKLSSSSILLYLLPLIVTPILSRIYTPEDYGDWGVFSSTTIIIGTILFGCYEYAIIKCNEHEKGSVCWAALCFSFLIISLTIGLFILGNVFEISYFKTFPGVILLIIYLIADSFQKILYNLANRERMYTIMSGCSIVTGGSQALFRIVFGTILIVSSASGLILGTVVAHVVALIFIIWGFRKYNFKNQFKFKAKLIKEALIKYRKFPLYDAPGSLLAFAAFNLPIIILAQYYDKDEIGFYSMVIQLLLLPMSFIGASVGKVYYQQISCAKSSNEIRDKSRKILNFTILLSVIPLIFLCLGGGEIMAWFLGSQWHAAGDFAICLSIWSVPTIITQPLLSIYRYKDAQNRMLLYHFIYFSLGIGSLIFMCAYTTNLYLTVTVYAVFCAISKFLMTNDMIKLIGLKYKQLSKRSYAVLIASIAIYIIRIFFIY